PKTTYSYSSYYAYGSSYYGDPAAVLKHILETEVAFADHVLRGPLHWLGLVDIGRKEQARQAPRLVAVRLTPVGAVALGLANAVLDDVPAAVEAQLIVQPNFQLFALGPLAPDVLAGVETFADRVKVGRGAFEYTLSRQSVYRAQQAGQSVADILLFLEDYATTDIPQNVRRTLEDWGALHQRIVLRDHMALCQVADPDLLDDLLADESTRALFAYRAAPHTAVIADGRQPDLLLALQDRGVLPTHSTDDPQRDVAGIEADDHGHIRFAHAVPSLHLEGRLARLAERTAAGEYAITQQSVRRALGSSFADVPALLHELETLHRGPVPHRLLVRIKAWAHYFGDAALQPLVLVQVQSVETLRELLDDPDLAPLIAAFRPASGLALAVADANRLDELRAHLAERGMALADRIKA
ncbi:MAG: helicase-associated domain-containing protein, partial [Chloroflexi bacterium]|nr:helicase-associated domain-containing protein [Chloroflexota bacterium]